MSGIDYSIPYSQNPLWQTKSIYNGMIGRCTNPEDRAYHYYGGRGIRVCDRWQNSFQDFLEDMGIRPDVMRSLDRLDPLGNYEPGNVKWNTHLEQALNKNFPDDVGVAKHKNSGLYEAYMVSYGKKLHLGSSQDKNISLKIRKSAEILRDHLREIGVYV